MASRSHRHRLGCLSMVVAVAAIAGWGAWSAYRFLNPPPVRIDVSASDFRPWPEAVEVVAEFKALGYPPVSGDFQPDHERLVVVVRVADGADPGTVVSRHLTQAEWLIETRDSSRGWYNQVARNNGSSERAYIGALDAYLADSMWNKDDKSIPDTLRSIAASGPGGLTLIIVYR